MDRGTRPLQDRLIEDVIASLLKVAVSSESTGRAWSSPLSAPAFIPMIGRCRKWNFLCPDSVRRSAPRYRAHEIQRLFFGHCRMEPPWPSFHFALGVSNYYEKKLAALGVYASVSSGDQARLLDKYTAEDRMSAAWSAFGMLEPRCSKLAAGRRFGDVRPLELRVTLARLRENAQSK
jgi:hypothetical protein